MKRLIPFVLLMAACNEQPAPTTSTSTVPKPPIVPATTTTPDGETPAPSHLLDSTSPSVNRPTPAEYRAKFETTKGTFIVRVVREWAPIGADRFFNLVQAGYYDDCRFFRVVPNFVVQWGIHGHPKVNAAWRSANLKDDPQVQGNLRGRLCFAKSGPNTRTTQVFINLKDNSAALDPQTFPCFGEVVEGMDVVEKLHQEEVEDQGGIQREGNAFLDRLHPKLDRITRATILN